MENQKRKTEQFKLGKVRTSSYYFVGTQDFNGKITPLKSKAKISGYKKELIGEGGGQI